MESHHQIMTRLIAEWHYQQENGLTWKEWAEGSPTGKGQFEKARDGTPRVSGPKLVPPNAGGCTDSPSGLSIIRIIRRGSLADF